MPAQIAPVLLPHVAMIPDGGSVETVLADLADDGVAAPASEVDGLRDVVLRAQEHGIKLSVVVVEKDPGRPEQLRDLATEVGKVEGGTVLVLGPSAPGTYSDSVSRVVLEAGQDRTYIGDPVVSANNFLDEITEPGVSWGLITALLVVLVVLVGGVSYVAKVRRGPETVDAHQPPEAVPSDQSAGDGAAREPSDPRGR
ncbi:DUF6676 family protein [Rhodococcus sp. ABRD24]|uniref:Rv1476 family membrane protein n=1 Tax=Rhodococcus sp. ABRD24 TaxID=2507582 RepID=UPI001A955766|nr:DUF6676 family protein [Rhodococcus sp. ABRD24]